eukprot:2961586-Ditylum_brightwellii.AAC.1
MQLLEEMKAKGLNMTSTVPKVHCKAFEDNAGALELAKTPNMHPCIKHINAMYHHFRDWVCNKRISLYTIPGELQLANLFTKPLAQNPFLRHCKTIMGG